MGSTNYLNKTKTGYRAKSGSSGGSDREMNGKLRRTKIKRPNKMNEYGLKRVPDYTELAYKEAVSKLRYFLSGNNVPSVRSYGGSFSGKIDESDGDLDKKYTSSYNTLGEYKPKPRLTAKYSTLYADSLNNYTPPQPIITTTAPAATAAELTGGTNPDVVNFIQKQEEYIEQLERESQYCRDELNNLLGKVKEVITENEHLHDAQKNKLISRMFHSYNEGSETDDLDDVGDSTGIDSDNKASPQKSRRAKSKSIKLEGPNIVFESRIAELEAQLTQAKIDLKKLQEENNENKRKLASGLVDSTCLDGFKRQIDNLQRDKSALESQISKLKLSLDQKDDDIDNRHKRGLDIIEQQLREERNSLETEVRRLKEELSSERNKVRELTGAGARRMLQERSAAELRHSAHAEQLARDLAAQYELAAKLQLDLDRQRRDENDLKREISMRNSAVEELKIELKNKSATLQADLAQAHAEKASLEEELASARLAMERQQRQARHETNRLNSEIQSLRQRLDRADADLVHSRRENLRLSEQISTLEKELNMKNLTPISPENNKKEKELSSMLESMENKHAKTVAELESMIQSQNSLMEKLTGECRLLTDKLDDANRRHKEELATLQRQIMDLGQTLQTRYTHTPSTFEAPTAHIPSTNRITNPPPSSGSDHIGSESTRDAPLGEYNGISRDTVNDYYETPDISNYEQNYENNDKHETERIEPESNVLNEPMAQINSENENDENQQEQLHEELPHEVVNLSENDNYIKAQEEDITSQVNVNMDISKELIDEKSNDNVQNNEEIQGMVVDSENIQYDNQNYDNNYDQNMEQPQFNEQYENYEQYPQQYTDPNAQYEGPYENYETDANYSQQVDGNYDNSQYNQDYTPQDPDTAAEIQTETNENSTPNDNSISQS